MKKALFVILVLLIAVMFMTACDDRGNSSQNGNGNENGDGNEEESWKDKSNVNENAAYTDLLRGALNSLRDVSDQKVNSTYPIVSVDSRMRLEINDLLLYMTFKLNYNLEDEDDLKFSVEITDYEDEGVIIGAYFKDNFLYAKILDGNAGELKFPIQNRVINELLPLEFDNFNVSEIATVLSAFIQINGNIEGQTRMNGTFVENRYTIDIDLPSTLSGIVNALQDGEVLDDLDTETLSQIIESVMGVTFEDIENETLPDSNVTLNFSTSDEKLSSFDFDLNVDQDETTQSTFFGGEAIDFSFSLQELITEREFTSIPFFGDNEHNDYDNYLDKSFGAMLNVTQIGETAQENIEYLLKAELKLDLEQSENNQLSFEALNDSDEPITGLYIYDNTLYIYQTEDDEYSMSTSFPVDIIDVYNEITSDLEENGDIEPQNDDTGDDTEDTSVENKVLEYVSFIVGALSFQEEKLSFTFDSGFYDLFLPNFNSIIEYMDEVLGDDIDLQQQLEDVGLDGMIDYFVENTFEVYIEFNEESENFIYVVDGDIDFPSEITEPAEDN